jgi:hypothetical protein
MTPKELALGSSMMDVDKDRKNGSVEVAMHRPTDFNEVVPGKRSASSMDVDEPPTSSSTVPTREKQAPKPKPKGPLPKRQKPGPSLFIPKQNKASTSHT